MTSASPKSLGSSRKRRIELAKDVILEVLEKDTTCYSKELFTKISPYIDLNWDVYKWALNLAAPNLDSIRPSTLVREKLLPSSYRDLQHTFYYLRTTDKNVVRNVSPKTLNIRKTSFPLREDRRPS